VPSLRPSEPRDAGMTTTFGAPGASRPLRRVMLRVIDGPDQGTQIQAARARLTVGRSAVADLVLTDSSISGLHAELLLGPDGVLLRDLKSTNGTTINGVRIQEAWVEPGMTLVLGKTAIAFLAEDHVDVPLSRLDHFEDLYGRSDVMRELFAVLERLTSKGHKLRVLINGETGTGKELVARALHTRSAPARPVRRARLLDHPARPRGDHPVRPQVRGTFTGAHDRVGCFEHAHGGTLFLDEIAELPLETQSKLLRVLEEGTIERVGDHPPQGRRPGDLRDPPRPPAHGRRGVLPPGPLLPARPRCASRCRRCATAATTS
jgi:pSer/pThr/pTyr-binding forkhead associated (FHA) protein